MQAAVRRMLEEDPTSAFEPRSFPETAIRRQAKGSILVDDGSTAIWLPPGAAGSVPTVDNTGAVAWKAGTSRMKAGSFNGPGSTGNLAITGLGFKPSMVMFTSSYADLSTQMLGGTGAMDAAGNQWVRAATAATSSFGEYFRTTACIAGLNYLGTAFYIASFVSMDTDGFTVNFTTANTSGRVGWVAFA